MDLLDAARLCWENRTDRNHPVHQSMKSMFEGTPARRFDILTRLVMKAFCKNNVLYCIARRGIKKYLTRFDLDDGHALDRLTQREPGDDRIRPIEEYPWVRGKVKNTPGASTDGRNVWLGNYLMLAPDRSRSDSLCYSPIIPFDQKVLGFFWSVTVDTEDSGEYVDVDIRFSYRMIMHIIAWITRSVNMHPVKLVHNAFLDSFGPLLDKLFIETGDTSEEAVDMFSVLYIFHHYCSFIVPMRSTHDEIRHYSRHLLDGLKILLCYRYNMRENVVDLHDIIQVHRCLWVENLMPWIEQEERLFSDPFYSRFSELSIKKQVHLEFELFARQGALFDLRLDVLDVSELMTRCGLSRWRPKTNQMICPEKQDFVMALERPNYSDPSNSYTSARQMMAYQEYCVRCWNFVRNHPATICVDGDYIFMRSAVKAKTPSEHQI